MNKYLLAYFSPIGHGYTVLIPYKRLVLTYAIYTPPIHLRLIKRI